MNEHLLRNEDMQCKYRNSCDERLTGTWMKEEVDSRMCSTYCLHDACPMYTRWTTPEQSVQELNQHGITQASVIMRCSCCTNEVDPHRISSFTTKFKLKPLENSADHVTQLKLLDRVPGNSNSDNNLFKLQNHSPRYSSTPISPSKKKTPVLISETVCQCSLFKRLSHSSRFRTSFTISPGKRKPPSNKINLPEASVNNFKHNPTSSLSNAFRHFSSSTSSSAAALFLFLICIAFAPFASTGEPIKVSIHAIIPRHFAMATELTREFSSTVLNFKRDFRNRQLKMFFSTEEDITFIAEDTPREILDAFCKGVLAKRAVTILNINNPLGIRRRMSSNQYILEIANYLGIPVISWDTEFTGSSQMAAADRMLQLAPTIDHQAMAIMSLLQRYNWTTFTIVTSQVAGDTQFVATMESLVEQSNKIISLSTDEVKKESFRILSTIHIKDIRDSTSALRRVVGSDTRVFLLHCSSVVSYNIIESAVQLGLTGKDYIWILTRSSIPTGKFGTASFPVGLIGISFEYDLEAMKRVVRSGVKMWLYALLDMSNKPLEFANKTMPPQFTCDSDQNPYWTDGDIMYRHMLNVSIRDEPQIEFNENGTLKRTEVIIYNLQWHDGQKENTEWKEVGRWKRHGLQMNDITWPGESASPPTGRPKRAFLRVATLNELPYVIYRMPEADGKCEEKALPCQVYLRNEAKELKSNVTVLRCCVGLTMDLLKIFSEKLNFDFVLKEVEDGKWGGINKATKQWNGLVKVLLEDGADIVATAMKINPERAEAVRFSVPYLETGIKIIVALRDGAISPTAFLEPFDFFSWILIMLLSVHIMATIIFLFEWAVPKTRKKQQEPYDYASWSLILVFSVHATGSSILIFEWLSPYGLNRGQTPMREHRFSLFRSFWLIWAMLFSTSVQTDSPKGIASRFLANIWALFALVFLASYTANLAAFMITKEVYYDLSGIQDYRLQNPYTMKPPFKYATIPNGSTEANIRANHKDMFNYMKAYNLPDVDAGIAALKQGKIQAFIYDSSVLEYYASRDSQCRLVTVGNRYAMTGYGIGFQPNFQNPWIDKFNKVILKLQENGELDRLQKFWLSGACNMNKETNVSNRTLGIINFTSAFILLGTGVLLGIMILCCEHLYFLFGRRFLRKWDKCGCCTLVSLSMGKSLEMRNCVDEAMHEHTKNRCKNALCETQVWKLKHQLDLALLKIDNLQNQLSSQNFDTEPLVMVDVTSHEEGTEKSKPGVVFGANGTGRRKTSLPASNINGASSKELPRNAILASPGIGPYGSKKLKPPTDPLPYSNIFGIPEDERTTMDNSEMSPLNYSDSLLPPPPSGESPLLEDESAGDSYDLAALGDNNYGGDTYVGFDDLSSNDSMVIQKSGGSVSPAHMLRRTPSYTSAIGGSMNVHLPEDSSPAKTGRVRQFDGKKYIGIECDSPPTV